MNGRFIKGWSNYHTHGVRGEVKVFPTTDPERFLDLEYVILDAGREMKKLEIRNVKFFKNLVILKFEGIDNINDIEMYKGRRSVGSKRGSTGTG